MTIPASTSPEPAVASQGGALSLMAARPSGAAITVSGPFRTTTAPLSRPQRAPARASSRRAARRTGAELALVRREHHRRLARLDGREQRVAPRLRLGAAHEEAEPRRLYRRVSRPRRKRGQRVGVQHGGCRGLQNGQDGRRRRGADAGAGPDQDGVVALVREELGQRAVGGHRAHHHGGRVRGVDGSRGGAADEGDEAGADASAARAPRRAAPVLSARPETTTAWPRWYLWPSRRGQG